MKLPIARDAGLGTSVIPRALKDPILIGALILGLAFTLYGIHWGIVEPWEPDQMAFYSAVKDGQPNLHPGNFLKPPFHKYLSLALARIPAYGAGELLGLSEIMQKKVNLLAARMLTALLFLAQIVLVYIVVQRFFGLFAARILCLTYATSAGFISFSHFLTADIPVTTWMLTAFCFAQGVLLRGRLTDYLLAGTFTGIATATKYNGLAIGIAFVVAHARASDWRSWVSVVFDRRLILGLVAVPVAFIVANPYSLLDASTFINHFMYNLVTTPVYGGETGGHNYSRYWTYVIEIIGLPAFLLCLPTASVGTWFVFSRRSNSLERNGFLMLLAISLLYYGYFGSFQRLETRFVLPIVPYLMMLAGPACERLRSKIQLVATVVGILLLYNVACSAVVGRRFVNDPRMAVRPWMRENLPMRAVVERSAYTPNPSLIEGTHFTSVRMPAVSGRVRRFRELLADNTWVLENIDKLESDRAEWFSPQGLAERAPDVVIVDSLYYGRFVAGEERIEYYPEIKNFFNDLLAERLGYRIVFDQTSQSAPDWAYPRDIDFLHNRIVVLRRDEIPEMNETIARPPRLLGSAR